MESIINVTPKNLPFLLEEFHIKFYYKKDGKIRPKNRILELVTYRIQGMTQEKVGNIFGVSHERIRVIEDTYIRRLFNYLDCNNICIEIIIDESEQNVYPFIKKIAKESKYRFMLAKKINKNWCEHFKIISKEK